MTDNPTQSEKLEPQAQRRLDIALGYIKRAANRELPKLPCRVEEMTEREVAIFNVCAAATGNLQFIARELDAMDSWLPSPASSPTPLIDAVIEVIAAEGGPVPTKWRKPDPSSPVPPEDLPFDDYCAGADCRNCKGINCTCPCHAPRKEDGSECAFGWQCSRPREGVSAYCVEHRALQPAATPTPVEQEQPFQSRVQPWLMECFGAEIAADKEERNHRFLEEALELVQACGATRSEAHQLVDYTFDRPAGTATQEVGGVMVTLAALCLAQGFDMHACGETELTRIWGKVETIRAKQAAKPKHSPLPEHVSTPSSSVRDEEVAARIVGTVFDNTAASHETLKQTMIERIADYLHGQALFQSTCSPVSAAPNHDLRSVCCDAPTRTANTDYNVCTACKEPCDTNIAVSAAGGDEDGEPLVADMQRALVAAGWIAESAIKWRAPDGSLWRGPYGAWKELQRRDATR